MQRRGLGKDGPEICEVGFGAWEAGGADWRPNESDEAIVFEMSAVFDAGKTWIDTAEVQNEGRSGQLVAGRRCRRDDIVRHSGSAAAVLRGGHPYAV